MLAVLSLEGSGCLCRLYRIWQAVPRVYDSKDEKALPVVVTASLRNQIIGAGSHSGCLPVGGPLKPLFTELLITVTKNFLCEANFSLGYPAGKAGHF
jgi:hypothetical protein